MTNQIVLGAPFPESDPPPGGKLIASDEGGKWYLCAQTADGDNYIELGWPWPGQEKSAQELIDAGFEIL